MTTRQQFKTATLICLWLLLAGCSRFETIEIFTHPADVEYQHNTQFGLEAGDKIRVTWQDGRLIEGEFVAYREGFIVLTKAEIVSDARYQEFGSASAVEATDFALEKIIGLEIYEPRIAQSCLAVVGAVVTGWALAQAMDSSKCDWGD